MYDLGLHVAWYPERRRQMLGGIVRARLIGQKAAEHGWGVIVLGVMPDQVHLVWHDRKASESYVAKQFKGWPESHFAGSAGVVSAESVRWCIGTRYECRWRRECSR